MSIERITEIVENAHDATNGAIDVNVQSQTGTLFNYFVMEELQTDITLVSDVVVDGFTCTVSAGHGFTASEDELFVIREGDFYQQVSLLSVVGDVLTVAGLFDNAYTAAGATIYRGNKNLNLNGAISLKAAFFDFMGDATATTPVDISNISICMRHASPGFDSLFGDLPSLSVPIYFRRGNGAPINLGTYVCNQCFIQKGASVTYATNEAGTMSTTNIMFDLRKIFGQEIRFDPRDGDYFVVYNPANLTSFTTMWISLNGSYTRGE